MVGVELHNSQNISEQGKVVMMATDCVGHRLYPDTVVEFGRYAVARSCTLLLIMLSL